MTKKVSKKVFYCCSNKPKNRCERYKMYSKKTNKLYYFTHCEICDTKYVYGIKEVEDD